MKYLKIVIINLLVLTLLYQILEISCFFIELTRSYKNCNDNRTFWEYTVDNLTKYYPIKYKSFDKTYENLYFRETAGSEFSDKQPILIFGCSYAFGAKLKENQTFSYKLSKYLHRKVYNRANNGWGPQNMLYQVQRPDFYNIVKETPAAVIYVFMDGHLYRTYREVWTFENQTFYKYSNGKLVQSPFKAGQPLYGYVARKIRYLYAENTWHNPNKYNEVNKFFTDHFLSAKQEMDKHWENTKYYILVYSCNEIEKQMLNNLNNKGFKVIYTSNLTDKNLNTIEYQISKNDMHPNENAWNLLTPLIANQLNLK